MEPVVGGFHLPAVLDALEEDAELVADAVAVGRKAQRGHGIDEAGREPPQAAVPQPRIPLLAEHLLQVEIQPIDRLLGGVVESQVEEIGLEQFSHQEFQRQVIAPPDVLVVVILLGDDPPFHQIVAHGQLDRLELVALGGRVHVLGQGVFQVALERLLQGLGFFHGPSGVIVPSPNGRSAGLLFWFLVSGYRLRIPSLVSRLPSLVSHNYLSSSPMYTAPSTGLKR